MKEILEQLKKLTSIRRDCFVPRNDGGNNCHAELDSASHKQVKRAIPKQVQDDSCIKTHVISNGERNLLCAIIKPYKISLSVRNDIAVWFRSHLTSFTLLKALCFLLSAFCLTGCSFNPNMQGRGQEYLYGEWLQDTSAIPQQLVTQSQYHIKFNCDSFFVQISNRSKVNYGAADTCTKLGRWSEYIKGNYTQKHDTLYLIGQFCNPDFSMKTNADCFRTGQYREFFTVIKKKDSLIQLSGTSSVIPIQLHLIKRISCHPKPL